MRDSRSGRPKTASQGRELLPLALLCAFLALALLTGGASRADAQSQILIRPLSVLFGAAAVFLLLPDQLRKIRAPLTFLLALGGIMLLQLIPLPPSVWTALPGRAFYADIANVMGMEQPWRPLTLSPSGTWNGLVSLLPPLAALLLVAAVSSERSYIVLTALAGLAVLSALMGLAQVIGSPEGPLYLYRTTNNGSAVGFFANRNHQAALLACLFPMLALLASAPTDNPGLHRFRFWACIGVAILLVPLILVTGSRSGVVLAALGVATSLLFYQRPPRQARGPRRGQIVALLAAGSAVAAAIAATLFLSRADAFYRLFDLKLAEDLRFRVFGSLTDMMREYFPFGTGFGSFEHAYRRIEPFEHLRLSYLNHAHNDLLELMIEGGLAGSLLLLAFLLWWAVKSISAWRAAPDRRIRFARLGSVITLLLLLASLVDYPLRTPFLMILFAIACAWLGSPARMAPKKGEVSSR
ncbi:MAG TPA: O-antigen ligase family protein [Allosphingosinicella sp.]|uniref:O-antigen ligase family protein n=1 Tax=Allosphingosinicella sp. TaxID=2823234 RepID=UPI002ED817C0